MVDAEQLAAAMQASSYPTLVCARAHGIDPHYAFLLGDMVLAQLDRSQWPRRHAWHVWAVEEATDRHGLRMVIAFQLEMLAYYAEKYRVVLA